MILLERKRLDNSLLLDALACKNDGRAPIWIMRQAGRYLPEYRAIRQHHSFMTMCRTPELAAEITLQPIRRFGFDAAIVFSDILVLADPLGLQLHFEEGVGPVIDNPIATPRQIPTTLHAPVSESLRYVGQAIELLKKELTVPLIGFAGAPFTVASYFIEGGSSKRMHRTKTWLFHDPHSFHKLLGLIADLTVDYLNLQIEAGVDAIQLFDSWANVLGYRQFREFSLPYLSSIINRLSRKDIPVILYCRGSSVFLRDLAEISPNGIGLDWNINLPYARSVVPSTIALQGNLDPDVLYAPLTVIENEVEKMLDSMKNDKGYIFNLGHGILPDIPLDAVKKVVETVKEFSR